MDKKQAILIIALAFLSGFIGGAISGKIFESKEVHAKSVSKTKIIEASEFRVVDDSGKTKATFGIVKGGTDAGLDFMANDKSSNEIHLSPTTGLFIQRGTSLSQLTDSGMTFQGDYYETNFTSFGFDMRSTKTKKTEILQHMFGKPLLQVGLIAQGLESRGEYPGIRLCDKSQRDRILIHLLDTGEPFISLNDDYMKTRAVLGTIDLKHSRTGSVETRSPSSLVLFNEGGNVIWSAP